MLKALIAALCLLGGFGFTMVVVSGVLLLTAPYTPSLAPTVLGGALALFLAIAFVPVLARREGREDKPPPRQSPALAWYAQMPLIELRTRLAVRVEVGQWIRCGAAAPRFLGSHEGRDSAHDIMDTEWVFPHGSTLVAVLGGLGFSDTTDEGSLRAQWANTGVVLGFMMRRGWTLRVTGAPSGRFLCEVQGISVTDANPERAALAAAMAALDGPKMQHAA